MCKSEHIATHDTLQNIVATIASKSGAHIHKEVSHLFLHHTWRQMDIVSTGDSFKTLANIVIVILIH
jgi:hypothetical protein